MERKNFFKDFNSEVISNYLQVIQQTPLPKYFPQSEIDPASYLRGLTECLNKLGTNQLKAISLTPYLYRDEPAYLWTFIFNKAFLDIDAIYSWLDDDCYIPVITNQDNITIVTINAI